MAARDPITLESNEPARIRALAHPARFAIINHLRDERQMTATELAEVVGLSPSATSYHLRVLAKAGFIQEAETRGDGRERLWEGLSNSVQMEGGHAETAEEKAAEAALWTSMMAWQEARTLRYLNSYYDLSAELKDVGALIEAAVTITPEESVALVKSIQELLRPYEREFRPEPPDGATRVSFMLRVIPTEI
jgi:DNA-binding transcriptional ArsR family regulator